MSFGKFGSRPRGVNNPIYWVTRFRQEEIRRDRQQTSIDKFNEKWHRLIDVHESIIKHFLKPLKDQLIDEQIADKLIAYANDAVVLRESIKSNINTCYASELSKYATALKKLALLAVKVCTKLQLYDDTENVTYNAPSKSILLNESVLFFLG